MHAITISDKVKRGHEFGREQRGVHDRVGQDESFHRLCKSTLESGLFKQDFLLTSRYNTEKEDARQNSQLQSGWGRKRARLQELCPSYHSGGFPSSRPKSRLSQGRAVWENDHGRWKGISKHGTHCETGQKWPPSSNHIPEEATLSKTGLLGWGHVSPPDETLPRVGHRISTD